MSSLLTTENLTALVTLTAMEIVLGIDNIVFISILVGKLPEPARSRIRSLGISIALVMRLLLLFSISWVMGLTTELFNVAGRGISGRDLILLGGGLFLIAKSTFEMHSKVEGEPQETIVRHSTRRAAGLVLLQILLLDIVFSLDSVITAVGMAQSLPIMVAAMLISMLVMLVSAGGIGAFVERHPTVKILALSFLLLIGVMLVMEGMGKHLDKGYIYFAMAFSLGVELLNIRYASRRRRAA